MGWLSRVKAALTKKKQPESMFGSRWVTAPARRGGEALQRAYTENPVLRVVEKVADHVAKVNWRVRHAVGDDGKTPQKWISHARSAPEVRWREAKEAIRRKRMVEIHDHALVRLLAQPNRHMGGRAFMKVLALHYELAGEAFVIKQRVYGVPVALWVIPPFGVIELPRHNAKPEERVYRVAFGQHFGTFPEADVIHIRNPDPVDPLGRGSGLGFALGDELDAAEYMATFIKTFVYNFGAAAQLITIEGASAAQMMNDTNIKAWLESINREHKGPENAGKTMVLPGKVTAHRVTSSFEEMELQKSREFEEKFVARVIGVPPEIRGDTATSNVASARAALAIMAEHVTLPRMEVFRDEFQRALAADVDPNAILDFDSPIPADRDHELKVAVAAPWSRDLNEWRELQGLEPVPQFEGVFPPLAMPGQQLNPEPAEKPTEGEHDDKPATGDDAPPPAAKHADPAWAKQLRNGVPRNR